MAELILLDDLIIWHLLTTTFHLNSHLL